MLVPELDLMVVLMQHVWPSVEAPGGGPPAPSVLRDTGCGGRGSLREGSMPEPGHLRSSSRRIRVDEAHAPRVIGHRGIVVLRRTAARAPFRAGPEFRSLFDGCGRLGRSPADQRLRRGVQRPGAGQQLAGPLLPSGLRGTSCRRLSWQRLSSGLDPASRSVRSAVPRRKGFDRMLFAMLYLIMQRLVGWAAGPSGEERSRDVEILVLRHQLKVLRRRGGRPRLPRWDGSCSPRRAESCLGVHGREPAERER
jgi:hypothetical protein